jgi:hypothetical protein
MRSVLEEFRAASLLGGACPPTRSPPSSVNPSSRGRPTVASSMNSGHRNLWESGAANRPREADSVLHGLSPGRDTMTQTELANVRNSFGVFGNVVGN